MKRHRVFLEKIHPSKNDVLLDIGGTKRSWVNYGEQPVRKIISLNLDAKDSDVPEGYDIECVIGNACQLEYDNQEFDIVYSNSVIEHVGDYEQQKLFAIESRRVGKKLWVQTPALECPIDPHYMTPFVHWLPVKVRRRIFRYFTIRGLIDKPTQQRIDTILEYTQLLSYRQMKELYPDCEIYVERLLWIFPKSFTAYRK